MDITITGLNRTYRGGVRALDNIDLTIPTGMFGLLGPNGSGKTTLMRILAGVLPASSGSVRVGAHDLNTEAGRRGTQRLLGYLPQEFLGYPELTVTEFLNYLALLKGVQDAPARRRRIAELLELTGLTGVAGARVATLSVGTRRRLGIAQALVADPRLLIVDEPTAGLDPQERIRFRALLSSLSTDRTVLLSTHIVEDVSQTCRELAVLVAGRIAFTGSAEQLVRNAAGRVWAVRTSGPSPTGTHTAAVRHADGWDYRVVAASQPAGSEPVTPTLEEAYVAFVESGPVPVRTGRD